MEGIDKIRRAINFDLHGKSLEKYFSKSNPKDAYRVLGKFFHDNGFKHRQGSGYVSIEPLTKAEVVRIVKKLDKQFPWLNKCTSCIDLTDIGETYNLKELFAERRDVSSEKEHNNQDKKISPDAPRTEKKSSKSSVKKSSITDRIAQKKEVIAQRDNKKKSPDKDKSNEHDL